MNRTHANDPAHDLTDAAAPEIIDLVIPGENQSPTITKIKTTITSNFIVSILICLSNFSAN